MNNQLENIRKIKKKYEMEWLQIEGVVAVGIGQLKEHGPGIIISTREDPAGIRQQIPQLVENVHIHLQKTGPIDAQ